MLFGSQIIQANKLVRLFFSVVDLMIASGKLHFCKGRVICPWCTTRRILETTAHLTNHDFPRLTVRHWYCLAPTERYFKQGDGTALNMVVCTFLRAIAQCLQSNRPVTLSVDKAAMHIGAIAFIYRFGSSLNEHAHFHICVVDGVFEIVADELWTFREPALAVFGLKGRISGKTEPKRTLAIERGAFIQEGKADAAYAGMRLAVAGRQTQNVATPKDLRFLRVQRRPVNQVAERFFFKILASWASATANSIGLQR